jgi:hypothetical protein
VADIAGLSATARRFAAGLCPDAVTVTRVTRGALNTATGQHATTSATVYSGPARLRRATSSDATVGDRELQRNRPTLVLPFGETDADALLPGDVVTVTTSADPALVGRTFTVSSADLGSTATARRYVVEEVVA